MKWLKVETLVDLCLMYITPTFKCPFWKYEKESYQKTIFLCFIFYYSIRWKPNFRAKMYNILSGNKTNSNVEQKRISVKIRLMWMAEYEETDKIPITMNKSSLVLICKVWESVKGNWFLPVVLNSNQPMPEHFDCLYHKWKVKLRLNLEDVLSVQTSWNQKNWKTKTNKQKHNTNKNENKQQTNKKN